MLQQVRHYESLGIIINWSVCISMSQGFLHIWPTLHALIHHIVIMMNLCPKDALLHTSKFLKSFFKKNIHPPPKRTICRKKTWASYQPHHVASCAYYLRPKHDEGIHNELHSHTCIWSTHSKWSSLQVRIVPALRSYHLSQEMTVRDRSNGGVHDIVRRHIRCERHRSGWKEVWKR